MPSPATASLIPFSCSAISSLRSPETSCCRAGIGDARIPTGGTEVVTHVGDVADGEEVDADVLLLGGEVTRRGGVEHLEAAVEDLHRFHHRHLEVQARLDVRTHHLAQVQDHGGLVLADHVHRAEQAQRYRYDHGDPDWTLHRLPSSRPLGRPVGRPTGRPGSREASAAAPGSDGITTSGFATAAGAEVLGRVSPVIGT
ncbi:hypothetical protein G6F57_018866 [Rhizopus arrhizus]|nr:hypothetical protein G6F57_018866 [Rhizopus arrhizus]